MKGECITCLVKIPGIDVNKPNQNPTVDSEYSYYELPFIKMLIICFQYRE